LAHGLNVVSKELKMLLKKYFTKVLHLINKIITFAVSNFMKCVLNTQSNFIQEVIVTKNNTPSMPLSDAHSGGLFFYNCIKTNGTIF
jgi:hypothetical protein